MKFWPLFALALLSCSSWAYYPYEGPNVSYPIADTDMRFIMGPSGHWEKQHYVVIGNPLNYTVVLDAMCLDGLTDLRDLELPPRKAITMSIPGPTTCRIMGWIPKRRQGARP